MEQTSTSTSTGSVGPPATPLRVRAAARRDRPPSLFVYLMFDNNDKDTEQTTSIEIAANPAADVLRYNRGLNKHRKSGKANARDWRLQQWVGPFNAYEAAKAFQSHWTRAANNLAQRIVRGAQLALSLHLAVYSMNEAKLKEMLV